VAEWSHKGHAVAAGGVIDFGGHVSTRSWSSLSFLAGVPLAFTLVSDTWRLRRDLGIVLGEREGFPVENVSVGFKGGEK
jgi:hypothetical protein